MMRAALPRCRGLRLTCVLCLLTAAPVAVGASDLFPRYEAALSAYEARMLQIFGSDPSAAVWSPQRRAQSACALSEVEARKGRAGAERLVAEWERAAQEARSAATAGDMARLNAQVHSRAKLSLQRDLVPITRTCGIGP